MMSVAIIVVISLAYAALWIWAISYCIYNRANTAENAPLLYNE